MRVLSAVLLEGLRSTEFDVGGVVYNPELGYPGGYGPLDGTVEFYGRIRPLLGPNSTVLDFGAGRGAWTSRDVDSYRYHFRDLRNVAGEVIGADVDPVVLENEGTHRNVLIENGKVPLDDQSVDLIVADYVIEHVEDVPSFVAEVDRLLRPGGFFCARTPHRWNYVSVASRVLANDRQQAVVATLQPDRPADDVFPTVYAMNTFKELAEAFPGWTDGSYLYSAGPSYYLGRKSVYKTLEQVHKILPRVLKSNIFVFKRKPPAQDWHTDESGDLA